MRIVSIELRCGYPGCSVQEPEGSDLVTTRVLTIDRRKPVEIDICKEHDDLVFNGTLDHLIASGRVITDTKEPKTKRVKAPSTTDVSADSSVAEALTCEEPGCGRGPFKGGAGLAVHVTAKHGYSSLAEYQKANKI